jgi:hypothetical protein
VGIPAERDRRIRPIVTDFEWFPDSSVTMPDSLVTIPDGTAPTRPVHPRSRGEHRNRADDRMRAAGSSPLARGTRELIIRAIRAEAVHPRSRGEHGPRSSRSSCQCGSSPLARGTLVGANGSPETFRFIPARAGNTAHASGHRKPMAVHPRSRGEHARRNPRRPRTGGSSPLARGTPVDVHVAAGLGRFIPARAGNTRPDRRDARPVPVHPRSRGEHIAPRSSPAATNGSSPLARGTPLKARRTGKTPRFIPARAGNTTIRARAIRTRTVHPRSRGEHEK